MQRGLTPTEYIQGMSDSELLARAADAVNYEIAGENATGLLARRKGGKGVFYWNPLESTEDAMLLDRAYGMQSVEVVSNEWPEGGMMRREPDYKATRRAIVQRVAGIAQPCPDA